MKFHKSTQEVEYLIDSWIFNERNRAIAKRKMVDGVTFERLAEEYDLSVQRVKTIVYECRDIILMHL